MNTRNRILVFAMSCAAIIGLMIGSTAAFAQGPGPSPSPTTSSGFRMYNSGTEWITIRSGSHGQTGTFLWPAPAAGIFTSDASGTMSIQSIDDLINNANLQFNHIWVGNPTNNPAQLAPGTANQVLQIDGSGAPTWQTINILPTGSTDNATLVWDQTNGVWIENSNVQMNPTTGDITTIGDFNGDNVNASGSVNVDGNSTLGNEAGDMVTINAGTVNAPNLSTTTTVGGGILVTDASGNVQEISTDDLIGGATLPENNIWVGDASDNPAAVAPGTNGQVLQINGSTPTWQTVNLLPTGSTNNATLVWDQTNGVWIENANVTMNPTSGDITTIGDVNAVDVNASGNATITGNSAVSGNATVGGNSAVDGNSTLGDAAGDAVTINAGTVTAPNLSTTTTIGGGVLVTDASGNIEEISADDLMGNTTLTTDHIWVGDASNNPGSVAPGNDQEVLMINGTTPTWTEINLLPDGTLNNSTLVWSTGANSWIENTKVTMSPITGNIETTGDLVADDMTLTGNTTLGDGASDDLTINGNQVTAPNLLTATAPDVNDDAVLVIDPTTNLIKRADADDIFGATTLNQNAIWVGDATNHPSELGAGTTNQVLQIDGSGAPAWQTINTLPTGTTNNATLVWDQTNGVWIENANVTMNPTSGDITTIGDVNAVDVNASGNATITGNSAVSGNATVGGNSAVDGNSTLGDAAGDAVTINAGTVTAPNLSTTTTVGGGVLVTDASGNVEEISPDDLMDNTTLTQNALWVGDASNNPTELSSSNNQGDVLTINASGTPVWSTQVGTVKALGNVAGTGAWTYTVNPGVSLSAASVIVVTLESSSGLQVTHVVNNRTATTFDVEFPVNIGATERFHWVVY